MIDHPPASDQALPEIVDECEVLAPDAIRVGLQIPRYRRHRTAVGITPPTQHRACAGRRALRLVPYDDRRHATSMTSRISAGSFSCRRSASPCSFLLRIEIAQK